MDWLYYILISIFSGVFAGMGMGGGTFLIPLLALFMKTEQIQAQAQNLVVFVPMAIVVTIIYSCQKLVDWQRVWLIVLPATGIAVLASLLAVDLSGPVLRVIFGSFVAVVGAFQLVSISIRMYKEKKLKKTEIKLDKIIIEK